MAFSAGSLQKLLKICLREVSAGLCQWKLSMGLTHHEPWLDAWRGDRQPKPGNEHMQWLIFVV